VLKTKNEWSQVQFTVLLTKRNLALHEKYSLLLDLMWT